MSESRVLVVYATRNIDYGAVSIFNEDIWNTNQSPAFTQLGHMTAGQTVVFDHLTTTPL